MHNQRLYAALLFTMVTSIAVAQEDKPTLDGKSDKPRIITTTDLGADPDDEQSMVRLLVSANEFDIEGLIVSTGCWKKSQSDTKMLDKLVDAYGECVDNLKVHARWLSVGRVLAIDFCHGPDGLWHERRWRRKR